MAKKEDLYEIISFERGFEYRKRKYAFKDKKLYRLPFISNAGTRMPLKEIPLREHCNVPYYRLSGDWKSQSITLGLCKAVKWTAEVLKKHKDLPC